jgi:methylmalonyl-CoA mutase N-terminal domain/subunit
MDGMGGAVKCIRFMQREIERSAYEAQQRIESGEDVVVGVNRFEEDDEAEPALFTVDDKEQERIRADLADLRASRDQAATDAALAALREACRGTDNLMPPILAAVEALATVGEICRAMEDVFGIYREA